MITSYTFGQMAIGPDIYTADLIICPDREILPNWRRKQGHILELADLTSLLKKKPEVIIAGTGVNDRMRMAPGLSRTLSNICIELQPLATDKAVALFNTMIVKTPDKAVSACFHLTC